MKTFKFTSLSAQVCALALAAMFVGSASAQTMTEAWVRSSGGANAVAVGANGTVFVTGNATTMAYSQQGVPLWTNVYSVPGYSLATKAIAVGSNGTVFVAGASQGSGTFDDYATFAYSQQGVPLWTNRYNGPGGSADVVNAIAVSTNGTVFITGYSRANFANDADYATIAYSQAGIPLWTNRYNGPGNSDDQANALALGTDGTVFVTGYSRGSNTWNDWATIAYSQEGVPLWTNRYDGPGNDSFGDIGDQATAMAVGTDGTVFVTGFAAFFNNDYNPDYATIAYSHDGVPLWTNSYNGPTLNGDDRATAVAVGTDGTVFVTGFSFLYNTYNPDYATIAYSHDGVPLWIARYNGPGNSSDGATAVVLGTNGNVFVTGTSYGSGSYGDFATIVYSQDGFPLSTNRYNGPANYADSASSLAICPDGVVVVGSCGDGSRFGYSPTLVKYSLPVYNTVSGLLLDDGAMRLAYMGTPNGDFALERTFNLALPDWIPQITNTADADGVLIFTNAPDPGENNFWRVRSVP